MVFSILSSQENILLGIFWYSHLLSFITHCTIPHTSSGSKNWTFPLTTSGRDPARELRSGCQREHTSTAANQNHSASDGTITKSAASI